MESNIENVRLKREVQVLHIKDMNSKILRKLIRIEKEGQIKELMLFNNCSSIFELIKGKATFIIGEDWYLTYLDESKNLYILGMVKGNIRFEDEEICRQLEMYKGLLMILKESIERSFLPIMSNMKEDTSYKIYLSALENGLIKQISEDEREKWESDDSFKMEIKRNMKSINQKPNYTFYMHEVSFIPALNVIPQIERRVGKIKY